jgi:16S rRNA G966 N2-methylase RsmD
MNLLYQYHGDNLDVLRRHAEDESIDLVYLDPPFNSNASYNVPFAERDGTKAAAQIKAPTRFVFVHWLSLTLPLPQILSPGLSTTFLRSP